MKLDVFGGIVAGKHVEHYLNAAENEIKEWFSKCSNTYQKNYIFNQKMPELLMSKFGFGKEMAEAITDKMITHLRIAVS